MTHPIPIENDAFRIEVWPQLGGKVSSAVDKADGFELLFSYPDELPDGCMYGMPYDSTWYAGWDECFPAVGPGPYVGHPYDGVPVPDHGEVYTLPTVAVPTKDGITTVWHGLRFGYRLTRKLALTPTGLTASYTLVNLAPFDLRFVWAQHALMSLESPVALELATHGTPWRWSHGVAGVEHQKPFRWPVVEGEGDLSRPSDGLPVGGWKTFSLDAISAPAVVHYPQRRRRLTISFEGPATPAFWGLWVNTGGWNHQRHFAVEPTTGRFDRLDRAVADGSAARVAGGATVEWHLRWDVAAH
jgi:hypothetical protein